MASKMTKEGNDTSKYSELSSHGCSFTSDQCHHTHSSMNKKKTIAKVEQSNATRRVTNEMVIYICNKLRFRFSAIQ